MYEEQTPVNHVILESPVHPVTEGHPLTLRCLYRNTELSNPQAYFYKDGSVLQTKTTVEMIIHNVSKSDEGFYHCKYTGRGESEKSWVSVRGIPSKSTDGAVGLSVGLSLFFLILIVLLILMILLWYYKMKKEKQQKLNQTSEQNQSRSGAEDSQSGHTPPQAGTENVYASVDQADMSGTGEAAAESNEAIYSLVTNKHINRNNGADAHNICDVMYAELELKPVKKKKRVKENVSVGDETVYSELQQK
ncbi:uncharacterized protein LOC128511639 [Clarias gariepinus]|uniref:uncharacterized protein LOC128511639 n=1 Tax=Clarias gariepinus TaxID=13013 RepID=UPI00234C8EAB|nr:uncharacterized protein LOC128511639 [Clarias gariepinus]